MGKCGKGTGSFGAVFSEHSPALLLSCLCS